MNLKLAFRIQILPFQVEDKEQAKLLETILKHEIAVNSTRFSSVVKCEVEKFIEEVRDDVQAKADGIRSAQRGTSGERIIQIRDRAQTGETEIRGGSECEQGQLQENGP